MPGAHHQEHQQSHWQCKAQQQQQWKADTKRPGLVVATWGIALRAQVLGPVQAYRFSSIRHGHFHVE
jgi:hypothetical protein